MTTTNMDSNDNPGGIISQFYAGKCIFITGVTGFMGKVLLHKLLNSCPMLERIYVLIRPKRDELPQVRLDKLLDGPCFKNLKETNASSFKKVFAIAGDISLPRLGMSNEDFDMVIEETSVVFHSAATVRFDEELRKYVNSIKEQKSGVVLTSMEPNIFRMLFSIKNKKKYDVVSLLYL